MLNLADEVELMLAKRFLAFIKELEQAGAGLSQQTSLTPAG